MPYVDHELMQGLIRRTIQNLNFLTPQQLSYACLNSFILHDKDPRSREVKTELFTRLEEYLDINQGNLVESISRKSAQDFLVSLSATKLGTMKSWNIAENLMQITLEKESKLIAEGRMQKGDSISKLEVLGVIHGLTRRKVQNKELWRLLMKPLVKNFNEGTISLRELANLTYDL
jgi:hypothetical protein